MLPAMMHAARVLCPAMALAFAMSALPGRGAARAEGLRILTSMPPAMTDPFIEGFRRTHPETEVLVLNKNTNSALAEVVRGNSRNFDIFWASAPESFALIATRGGFDAADCGAADPNGYLPFAYSSIGWARRTDSTVFMPGYWDDLLMPHYRGRVGMALPSRSGTSHMMVERFLQVRGWADGWAYFLRLSDNLATISARSFGVIDGVDAGRFDIGLSIDFLAETHPELDFRYGQPVMIFPAQIGLLKGGKAAQAACDFLAFVTSDQGQRLLLRPDVGRVPASAAIREEAGDAIPRALDLAIRRSWQGYDADQAQARYWAVNMIFDLFIAETLPRRRELFARLRALDGKAAPEDLAALHRTLLRLPVTETEAQSEALNVEPGHASDLIRMTEVQRDAHARWSAAAKAQLDKIEQALTRLETSTP